MSDKLQLVYFDVRGRAEFLRLLLHATGQPFEDVRVSFEAWPQRKSEAPYGKLPYLEYKGKKYGQSLAIGPFLARKFGMYGKTEEDGLRIDEVTHLVDDFRLNIRAWRMEQDPQKKAELIKKMKEDAIPCYLVYFKNLLAENSDTGFFVGNSVTLADVMVYDIIDTMMSFDPEEKLTRYPALQKLRQNVENIPAVKEYLKNRPTTTI
ncbi:glutathione S-transferase 3-like [Littorina saxatilis]|uniref:Glutathione transferase n=1 Tax=Littorina saxatilis TaxID=31220 RepID=A0AAN9GC72_9CAEN|eukprot:GHVL01006112.1.p1 GENE.GHVL01006112.1~~GHVL01006112.1.p1  ORF type:complete len:207 (-),score=6.10 GHVL01006112.1:486-1106(-)